MLACLATGLSTSACTIDTSELQDALKLPEVTPEVEASFESAVSTVTAQVLDAAMEAAEDATTAAAPAFSKSLRRLADTAQAGQTIDVNVSKKTEDGGTINVTGTITSSGNVTSGTITLNLKADWANLTVNDGTATQKTTGSETVTGTMTWTADTFSVNLGLKGSFSLGSDNYAFEVTMTMEGDKMVYSGTVNGQTVSGNVPVGDEDVAADGQYLSCVTPGRTCMASSGGPETCYDYDRCIEFTDAAWTPADTTSVCGFQAQVSACPTAGLLGVCTGLVNGKNYKYYSYSTHDKTKADCETEGGVWTTNQ